MGRRFFEWSSLAFAVVQLGVVACNRDGRDRSDEPQSGIVSPRVGELGHKPAIGGGPRSVDDGGVAPPDFLEDLDPGTSNLQVFDGGTTGMTTSTGTGTTGSDTTRTTGTTGTSGTTGTGTTSGTSGTGTTGTGTTGTMTTGTGTTGTGTTGTMSTTVTGAGSRI